MNHLPKLSAGIRRTAGAVPTTLGRGVVAAWHIDTPVFPIVPGDRDLRLIALSGQSVRCTDCKPDPDCGPEGARYCTYPPGGQIPFQGVQGGSQTVKECCPPPRLVCGSCE